METAQEIEQLKLVAEISGLKPPQVVLPQAGDLVVEGFRLHYLDWGTLREPREPSCFFMAAGSTPIPGTWLA